MSSVRSSAAGQGEHTKRAAARFDRKCTSPARLLKMKNAPHDTPPHAHSLRAHINPRLRRRTGGLQALAGRRSGPDDPQARRARHAAQPERHHRHHRPDAHDLSSGKAERHRRHRRAGRRLPLPLHQARGHGGLRMAELPRRHRRAAHLSHADQRGADAVRKAGAGCPARHRPAPASRRRMGHRAHRPARLLRRRQPRRPRRLRPHPRTYPQKPSSNDARPTSSS